MSEIPAFFGGKHIVLSVSEFEGTSISMLEAMGQGVTPVVTDIASGVRDVIVAGENGWLVPMGDMPASQVFGFRLMDNALHAWDLARGIGADDTLDPRLVEAVWGQLAPIAEMLPAIGVFGEGPSGAVGDDATLQHRLLDLTGRRP